MKSNKNPVITISYIRFLRIKDWFYIVGLAWLGLFFGAKQLYIKDLFFLSVASSLYLAHGYSLNNYFDLKQPGDSVLIQYGEGFNSKVALFISLLLFGISIAVSLFYSKIAIILIILGAVISFLYSSSLFRFKKVPLLNIVLNSTGFTILFLLGFLMNKRFDVTALCLGGYIWLGIVPSQLVHLMSHRYSDAVNKTSLKTLFTLLYMSVFAWAATSFIFFYALNNFKIVFVLTLLVCLAYILVIEVSRCRSAFSIVKITRVRFLIRLINIVFGFMLLYFLYHYSRST